MLQKSTKGTKQSASFLDDLDDELFESITINKHIKQFQTYNVYISKPIGPAHQYISLLDLLRTAHPSDTIFIHLNTPGGQLDTGTQIVHAIQDSPGRIITVLDGSVCSMGALIFLAANEYIVNKHGQLMFHNYSSGIVGKGHEIEANLLSTNRWYHGMLQEICSPFLSDDEISEVIKGSDLWLSAEEVQDRLADVVAIKEQEMQQLEEEQQLEQEKEVLKRIAAREKKQAKLELKKKAQSE